MTGTFTDAQGQEQATPMVLLLEIEDGLIVSELDISDAACGPFQAGAPR